MPFGVRHDPSGFMTPFTTTSSPSQPTTRSGLVSAPRALAMVLAVVLVAITAACGSSEEPVSLSGWVREPLPTVDTVALPDVAADNAPFEFRAPEGGLLLVYFGFTFCPDMCPTTLSDVQTALTELGDEAADVEVAFVTVDPNRDTGEALSGYIGFFTDGNGHALRTDDPDQLKAAADAFGVEYEVVVNDDGEVDVGHTAHLYAVDDQGRLLITWPFGVTADALATDIAFLLSDQAVSQRNQAT
jgi:protein SCO1/2